MKLPLAIAMLFLLVLPACDKADDAPSRPDLKAPAKKSGAGKADAKAKPAVADGRVFFVAPADGATVSETFELEFGVEGKEVRPAGATERAPAFGHHHLLIDLGPIDDLKVVPKNEANLHYGDGATKTQVKLPPGTHKLTMQFADGAHRSYGPDWAATITVEVEAAAEAEAAAEGGAEAAAEAGAAAADGS